MFKLVVLFSAMCALAAAKPGGLLVTPIAAPLAAPLAYTSTIYSPITTLTKTSTVLQPATLYKAPTLLAGAHFIKKRSAPIAPLAYSSAVIAPVAFSSQSRFDFPTKTIYSAAAPIISTPISYIHV